MYYNGNCWYRQVITVVHSKHIMLLLLHYFSNAFRLNIVGQDQEIWTTDAGKWHFEKQYMHWFCGWFIRTRRNEQYLQENDIWERWIEVSLCCAHFWTSVSLFAMVLVSIIIQANGDSCEAINPSCLPILGFSWLGNRIAIFLTKAKASRHNPTVFIQNMCTVGRQWNIKCKNPVHVTLL